MIRSFRHKGLKRFYETGALGGIQPSHSKRLGMILSMLDVATEAQQLDLPGLRLHALKGDLHGRWSVTVNGNWRLTFHFVNGDAELLDYVDYH